MNALRIGCLLAVVVVAVACRDPGRDEDNNNNGGSDLVNNDPFAVMTCSPALAPPSSGSCSVTMGNGTGILFRGNVLAGDTGFEHGSVLIDGDSITCVGCDCSATPGFADATVIECPNAAISAGLINPHDHLTFTEGAPIDTQGERYSHRHEWRGTLRTPANPHGTEGGSEGMQWGELRMLFGGATSLVGSGAATGLIRNLDRLEGDETARGLRELEFQTFSLGDSNETFHADCTWDFRYEEAEVAGFNAFLPHVAEGIDDYAAEEFRCQSRTQNGARDYTERNTAHIHSIGLSTEDYFRMVADNAQLIWSPRSNISLYGFTAQVTTFHQMGGVIALGTDWTYSGSVNPVRELACAAQYNENNLDGYFTDRQLHDMATINAAIATGTSDLLGSLEPGKLADIAIFAGEEGAFHRSVIDATNSDVLLVVKGGEPLYGQSPLVAAFGETCDPVDVCGEMRSVCTTREFGKTFATIQNAVQGGDDDRAYDAIFCDGIPAGEPTCTPIRPGQFSGPRQGDDDGDGLKNGDDNCSTIFNPIRPIDFGEQPDADGDGFGDSCDSTPLNPDLDADGAQNVADNCPFDANTDQLDGDSDDKGNACDTCPMLANPSTTCPEGGGETATIMNVQNGTIAIGTRVLIPDVVVTGVGSNNITVQDPNADSPEFSGVNVVVGGTPSVTVGTLVDVAGEVGEFFDNTEIGDATVTDKGSTTPIAPADVSVPEAASEEYEGVLVRVSSGTTASPYDCKQDNASCNDTNLYSITDQAATVVAYDRFYGGSTPWSDRLGDVPVAGVMMFRHNSRRIMPRGDGDF